MKIIQVLKRLWREERGAISPLGIILITAIVAIGGIVGLAAVRDHITQQMGDIGVALDNLDQSFSYSVMVDGNLDGDFGDPEDDVLTASYVDPDPTLTDTADTAPACLTFSSPAGTAEGDPDPPPTTGEFP